MKHRLHLMPCTIALIVLSAPALRGPFAAQQPRPETPETVMVTFHAKSGGEADLARVIARHWDTARSLNLVLDTPHVTLRGTEDGEEMPELVVNPLRPGRSEPRCKKRRPKQYDLMGAPRAELRKQLREKDLAA